MTRTARQGLGDAGEKLARRFLEQKGYTFVTQNWRCRFGELDLVMRDGEVLVIVEVKTRRGEQFGAAEESITPAKAGRLLHATQSYVVELPESSDVFWRIDLVAITLGASGAVLRVTHIVDALHGA